MTFGVEVSVEPDPEQPFALVLAFWSMLPMALVKSRADFQAALVDRSSFFSMSPPAPLSPTGLLLPDWLDAVGEVSLRSPLFGHVMVVVVDAVGELL